MSDAFVGEIRLLLPQRATGWALCEGQLLAISQNPALFSLLGTTYGGDGRTTFGLPDLRGGVPISFGTSKDGNVYAMGQKAGEEVHTLAGTECRRTAMP